MVIFNSYVKLPEGLSIEPTDRLDSYAELVERLRSEVAHERAERQASGAPSRHRRGRNVLVAT